MAYKFIKTQEPLYKGQKEELEILVKAHEECGLTEMLEKFERFLKACGYIFEGTIGIDEPEDEGQ